MKSPNERLNGADWKAYRQMQQPDRRSEKIAQPPKPIKTKERPRSPLMDHLRFQRKM